MYTIKTCSERGRYAVANTRILQGTVVLKETPALVSEDVYDALYKMYYNTDLDDTTIASYESLVPMVIDRYVPSYADLKVDMMTLPEYMKEYFLNWKADRLRLLIAKFHRNAFTYNTNNKSLSPCAILLQGTLFNHSCDNNLDFCVNDEGVIVFTTNRDIAEGEELCDRYIETNASRKKRQHTLLNQYGFICSCEKCKITT
jgi:hypothetical protein